MQALKRTKNYFAKLLSWHHEYVSKSKELRQFQTLRLRDGLHPTPDIDEILQAPYVFVLSTGRCGTALLSELLKQNQTFWVHHDPQPALEFASSYAHRHCVSIEALKVAILAARFESHFVQSYMRTRVYVETNNRITFFSPALADLLPNAKFIHLVRHPGDFVRSGMRRGYYEDKSRQYQRLRPVDSELWDTMSRQEKIAWEWNEINQYIESLKSNVPDNRILTINSESLFGENKSDVLAQMWQFLNHPNPHVTDKGREILKSLYKKPINAQTRGVFPAFKHWNDEDKSKMKDIVGDLADRYGYQC